MSFINLKRFSLLSILSLLVIPVLGFASETTIKTAIDPQGFLQAVVLTTPDVIIRVGVYGNVEEVTANDPKLNALNVLNKSLNRPTILPAHPLTLSYYPRNPLDGNSGKLAEVNQISIRYFPCNAANQTLNSIQYVGQNMTPAPSSNNPWPLTANPQVQNACGNPSNKGGKVSMIGDITFNYNNDGKLSQVGRKLFSYYPPNSFSGQPGQLIPSD